MNSTVPIRPPRLLDKQNVARFGHIDRGVSDRLLPCVIVTHAP